MQANENNTQSKTVMETSQNENGEVNSCDIELHQSIIESFARFLVPKIREYYGFEHVKKAISE